MMPGMMLPTALPFLVGFAHQRRREPRAPGIVILIVIYALVWAVLGAAAWVGRASASISEPCGRECGRGRRDRVRLHASPARVSRAVPGFVPRAQARDASRARIRRQLRGLQRRYYGGAVCGRADEPVVDVARERRCVRLQVASGRSVMTRTVRTYATRRSFPRTRRPIATEGTQPSPSWSRHRPAPAWDRLAEIATERKLGPTNDRGSTGAAARTSRESRGRL